LNLHWLYDWWNIWTVKLSNRSSRHLAPISIFLKKKTNKSGKEPEDLKWQGAWRLSNGARSPKRERVNLIESIWLRIIVNIRDSNLPQKGTRFESESFFGNNQTRESGNVINYINKKNKCTVEILVTNTDNASASTR
jgi:hypothetical protein